MDDWISFVYGSTRTFRAKAVPVVHHTGAHGQRYLVDHSNENLLQSLVFTIFLTYVLCVCLLSESAYYCLLWSRMLIKSMTPFQVEEGRKRIRKWMLQHQVSSDTLNTFDNDVYKAGLIHKDIPSSITS